MFTRGYSDPVATTWGPILPSIREILVGPWWIRIARLPWWIQRPHGRFTAGCCRQLASTRRSSLGHKGWLLLYHPTPYHLQLGNSLSDKPYRSDQPSLWSYDELWWAIEKLTGAGQCPECVEYETFAEDMFVEDDHETFHYHLNNFPRSFHSSCSRALSLNAKLSFLSQWGYGIPSIGLWMWGLDASREAISA